MLRGYDVLGTMEGFGLEGWCWIYICVSCGLAKEGQASVKSFGRGRADWQ